MRGMASSYSQIPSAPIQGWVARIFHRGNKAPVSALPPPPAQLLAAIQERGDASATLNTQKTMGAACELTRHHLETCPAYWVIRLLLEWHFGRVQTHQLISYKVLDGRGWCDSLPTKEASADLRTVFLPQLMLATPDLLIEALDYKIYGVWLSQRTVALRTMPDTQCLLNTDAAVNFWLPDSVLDAADALGKDLELTRSDVIRNILFLHLYGRIFYEHCLAQDTWKARWRNAGHFDHDIMFSRSTRPKTDQVGEEQHKSPEPAPRSTYIAAYGKSVKSIKVWLPSVMREHLEQITESKNNALAETLRRVLTTDLLGRAKSNEEGESALQETKLTHFCTR